MYEVCMSADRRIEPSFNNTQNHFNQNSSGSENWDYDHSQAPAHVNNLVFEDESYSNTGSLLIKSGMFILLILSLYIGHMIYKNTTHQTAELKPSNEQILAASQNNQNTIRKIDLTKTASVRKVKTVSFKKPIKPKQKANTKPILQHQQNQVTTEGSLKFHTVQPGDTISRIGRLHKLSAAKIMEINNIENPRFIKPGMKIVVSQ